MSRIPSLARGGRPSGLPVPQARPSAESNASQLARRVTTKTTTMALPSTSTTGSTSSALARRVTETTTKKQVPPGAPRQPIAQVKPAKGSTLSKPSLLQKKVFKQALSKSALDPKKKVTAVGATSSVVPSFTIQTKRGEECVVQQMIMETTIQRTPQAEYIGKTMTGIDSDGHGVARQFEVTTQQIDPSYAIESAGINETVAVTSSVSVTSGGKQFKKTYKKKTLKAPNLSKKPNMNPAHINRLVREEAEDVENTLKMVPPDLASTNLETFPLKRKLQNLRLTSESIALLEQSVIHPAPTADEIETEAPPEVLASVIHAVEKGATPDSAPNQIFNSLFPEVPDQQIRVSSIAPGPLQDIIVPTDPPKAMTDEVLNEEMEKSVIQVQTTQQLPADDICAANNITAPPRTSRAENKKPMLLEIEIPPWEEANVEKIATLVGGEPIESLEAADVSVLETSQELNDEMAKGIDFFIDAHTPSYETRVQIRGSKLPEWFPGYLSTFPHLPEVVKLNRSPSGVLHSAWKAVQPKLFPEDSVLIV